jgi:hypothetical protein
MCANRKEDNSGSMTEQAWMTNRCPVFYVIMDIDDQMSFMKKAGMPVMALAYAASHAGVVFSEEAPDHEFPFSTARSFFNGIMSCYDMLPDDFDGAKKTLAEFRLPYQMLKAWAGADVAPSYSTFLETTPDLPDMKQVLRDPTQAHLCVGMEAQFITMFTLMHRVEASMVNGFVEDEVNNIVIYIKRFGKADMLSMVVNTLMLLDPSANDCAEIVEWVRQNQKLVIATLHTMQEKK